jgi:hypothetical protein
MIAATGVSLAVAAFATETGAAHAVMTRELTIQVIQGNRA